MILVKHIGFPLLALTLALTGCTGELVATGGGGDDDGAGGADAGSGGQTARQMFDNDVSPVLQGSCAGCHAGVGAGPGNAPRFMGTGPATEYYSALIASNVLNFGAPATSTLLTTGVHYMNAAPAIPAAELPKVSAWLTAEAAERNQGQNASPDAGPPPITPAEALEQFGNCMRLEDFTASGMPEVALQGTDSGTCEGCHDGGLAGAFLSADATQFFNMTRISPYINQWANADRNPDGSFKDISMMTSVRDKGTSAGHPQYSLTPARLASIEQFYALTYQHYMAGDCPPQQ